MMELNPGDFVTSDLECLDKGTMYPCEGPVEFREPLSATGKSFARCTHHWNRRLQAQERINKRYPDSPIPPEDYDLYYAGEAWDED